MKYEIIYADPPWKFNNKKTGGSMGSGAESQYATMSISDLTKLNVNEISNDNSVLFMWWVASMPLEAIALVEAWGFELKTMTAFTWIKKTKNWKDFFGMGFYTRQQCENCLVATKGKPKILNHNTRQIVRAVNIKHSKKPNEVRTLISKLYIHKNKIELFARDKVEGWENWGFETQTVYPKEIKIKKENNNFLEKIFKKIKKILKIK